MLDDYDAKAGAIARVTLRATTDSNGCASCPRPATATATATHASPSPAWHRAGSFYRTLAKQYGVSGAMIGKIIRGERWRRVWEAEHHTSGANLANTV